MAKTIENFRAEYGVRLDTLSEVTGIQTEVLASSERILPAPPQIAQIIIEKYNLPPYYFTGISQAVSSEEKMPYTFDKFIVPSFIWTLVTSLVISLPSFIGSLIISITAVISRAAGFNAAAVQAGVNNVVPLVNRIWIVAVIIISCSLFSKRLEEKFGFSSDKSRFKYLYWIIPGGMTGTVSYIINNIFYNTSLLFAKTALGGLCSLVGSVCIIVLTALMLKAVSSYGEKDRQLLNFFYIFCGANTALHAGLSILFGIIHGTFPVNCIIPVIEACIIALLSAELVREEKAVFDKKVRFTVLPLAYVIVPQIISIIKVLFDILIH